ncbi:hypothetical protein IJ579_06010, partial [bacterium]|nr:hypothetical protein [bacterium]
EGSRLGDVDLSTRTTDEPTLRPTEGEVRPVEGEVRPDEGDVRAEQGEVATGHVTEPESKSRGGLVSRIRRKLKGGLAKYEDVDIASLSDDEFKKFVNEFQKALEKDYEYKEKLAFSQRIRITFANYNNSKEMFAEAFSLYKDLKQNSPLGEKQILDILQAYDIERLRGIHELYNIVKDKVTDVDDLYTILSGQVDMQKLSLMKEMFATGKYTDLEIIELTQNVSQSNIEFARKALIDRASDISLEDATAVLTAFRNMSSNFDINECADFIIDFLKRTDLPWSQEQKLELAKNSICDGNYKLLDYLLEKGYSFKDVELIMDYAAPIGTDISKQLLDMGYNIADFTRFSLSTDCGSSSANLQGLNLKPLKDAVDYQRAKAMESPELYVNGEFSTKEDAAHCVYVFFNAYEADLMTLASIMDKEGFNSLLRRRLDDAANYLDIIGSFKKEDLDLLRDLCNGTNVDGKPIMPTQKVEFIDLIQAYKDNHMDMTKIRSMAITGKVDFGQLNVDLFKQVMKNAGMSDAEIADIPIERLMGWDKSYLHLLAKDMAEFDAQASRDIVRAGNLEDFMAYIHDTDNVYGRANASTRRVYSELGIDYEKWIKPSKDSEVRFVSRDKNLEQLSQIGTQLVQDIEALRKTPAKGFIDKQFPKCIKDGKFVIPSEYLTSKAKLEEFTNSVLKQLDSVFKRAEGNLSNSDPARVQKAQNTLTIRSHIENHIQAIKDVSETGSSKTLDLTIKMWDRNPQKDLFQGNYSTCCIGMGGGNGWAMPHYIMNTSFNMIELVDNLTGKTIGNALCYFVEGPDGRPALIIDNIEINNSWRPSDDVGIELRDYITEYAANIAREVTGNDETPIYMSSHYNDVPCEDLPGSRQEISFAGDMDCDDIYLDLYDGWIMKSGLDGIHELRQLKGNEPLEPKTRFERYEDNPQVRTQSEEVRVEENPEVRSQEPEARPETEPVTRPEVETRVEDSTGVEVRSVQNNIGIKSSSFDGLEGRELINAYEAALENGTYTYGEGFKSVLLDDGVILAKSDSGEYIIEYPADTHVGYRKTCSYDSNGKLRSASEVISKSDGKETVLKFSYDENGNVRAKQTTNYVNGFMISDVVKNGSKVHSTVDTYRNGTVVKTVSEMRNPLMQVRETTLYFGERKYYQKVEVENGVTRTIEYVPQESFGYQRIVISSDGTATIDGKPVTVEEARAAMKFDSVMREMGISENTATRVEDVPVIPAGHYLDKKTGQIIKVDKDKLQVQMGERDVVVKDEFGNVLGQVGYMLTGRQGEETLYFLNFKTEVNGLGIGTMLIDVLKKKASELGVSISADADPTYLQGSNKGATNLAFYYKMGFRAKDPGIDKLVCECLDKDLPIPTFLNHRVAIDNTREPYVKSNSNQVSVRTDIESEARVENTDQTVIRPEDSQTVTQSEEVRVEENPEVRSQEPEARPETEPVTRPEVETRVEDSTDVEVRSQEDPTVRSSEQAPEVHTEVEPETRAELSPEVREEIRVRVFDLITQYEGSQYDLKNFLRDDLKLNKIGNFYSRVKSETSLRDKVENYMKDHPGATIDEAIADVRDAFGARTVVESNDFTNNPEVAALIAAGDTRGAMLKAAELQSQPAVDKIKDMIDMIASGEADFEITRITNYVSKDGIPYFSDEQLAFLSHYAATRGLSSFDTVIRIAEDGDYAGRPISREGKLITKSQPSGYTALQMNIKTKDGKVIEWQFRGDKVHEFAEGEHIPYDLRTGKNILGDHPELEPLYKPLQDLLCGVGEDHAGRMPDAAFDEYNRYLNDYYAYLRKLELGFDSEEPRLEDYGNGYKFDKCLEAKNLIALHKLADEVKGESITVDDAVAEYKQRVDGTYQELTVIKENTPFTPDELREYLLEVGFTEEEIADIDLNNLNLRSLFKVVKDIFGMSGRDATEFLATPEQRADAIEEFLQPMNNKSKRLSQYANKENFRFFSVENSEDSWGDALDLVEKPNFPELLEVMPIYERIVGKMDIKDAACILDLFTRNDIRKKINETSLKRLADINGKIMSPESQFGAIHIIALEDVPQDIIDAFIKETNELSSKHGFALSSEGLTTSEAIIARTQKLAELNKVLDEYPQIKELVVSSDVAEKLVNRNDMTSIVKAIMDCPEAQRSGFFEDVIKRMPDNKGAAEACSKLFELGLHADSVSQIVRYCKNGDFDGLNRYIEEIKKYKDKFSETEFMSYKLYEVGIDYDSAISILNKAGVYAQTVDCGNFYQIFDVLRMSRNNSISEIIDAAMSDNISLGADVILSLSRIKNPVEAYKKALYVSKNYDYDLETSIHAVERVTYSKTNVTFEQFKEKLDVLTDQPNMHVRILMANNDLPMEDFTRFLGVLREKYGDSQPHLVSRIISKINNTNKDVFEKAIEQGCLDRCAYGDFLEEVKEYKKDVALYLIEHTELSDSAMGRLVRNSDGKNNDFILQVVQAGHVNEQNYRFLASIAGSLNEENKDFFLEICLSERYGQDLPGISRFCSEMYYRSKEQLDLARDLVHQGRFEISEIGNIAGAVYDNKSIEFIRGLCEDTQFSKDEIVEIAKRVVKENENMARYLCSRSDFPHEDIPNILKNYDRNDAKIKEIIENGTYALHPELKLFGTRYWERIIERNIDVNSVPESMKDKMAVYWEVEDPDIIAKHMDLYHDAYSSRDLLKTGLEDLTDRDIDEVFLSSDAVKALDIMGKGNLEAAFPMMIDGFEDFIEEVAKIHLSESNKAALIERINPTNSPRYRALGAEIVGLKKQLNMAVGTENLARIQELQAQKLDVDNKIKELNNRIKTMDSNDPQLPELKKQLKDLQKQSKTLGSQAQSIYFQNENVDLIKELMKQISTKQKEMQNLAKSASVLEPQDVITKVRVIAALAADGHITDAEIRGFIDMIQAPSAENEARWNEAVNRKIYEKLGVEYDEVLSQKLDLVHCKYLSQMFVSSTDFFHYMKKLVTIVKENPDKSVEEIFDSLPQNMKTREEFAKLGIDYERWTKVDRDSFTSVELQLDAETARQAAISNLEEDLNSDLFQRLPQEIREGIMKRLSAIGVTFERSQQEHWVGDGFDAGTTEYYRLFKDGQPIKFSDMEKIVSEIKKEINSNEFWTTGQSDLALEEARGTLYTHLVKQRTAEVDNAASLKDGEVARIEVHKTDMYDVKKALGLGNDGQCCTALGRDFNEYSAPTYIMNKCIGAIELTDNGSFIGNTMIYIAYVDGEPALVLDNIELKTKYHNNDAIRDAFVEYAKKLCVEIGQPDLPIYAGPNRHKLNMSIYPKEEHSMQVVGSTGSDRVYLDYDASGHVINGTETARINMYRLR